MKYVAIRDIDNKVWIKYSHEKITLFLCYTVHQIHIDTNCMKFIIHFYTLNMILKMEHAINNSMKIKYYSTLSYNLTMIIALLVL